MSNHTTEEIKHLMNETEKLCDLYQRQLDDFNKTNPKDLTDDETFFDAKAQGTSLDLDEIYQNIKRSYEDTIDRLKQSLTELKQSLIELK
ncbi:hypothetical protein [uncultured Acinetobacter sp.]|uniref:hypothetical protein n=1 Tax=uncultured Acinetobacter sp. TaxID=165433 RepID=UPI00258973FE|nr:hypothetical protein [uncultured Acinetobacter sp.]